MRAPTPSTSMMSAMSLAHLGPERSFRSHAGTAARTASSSAVVIDRRSAGGRPPGPLRGEKFDELAAFAEQRGLPVSTVVRTLVLQAIAPADALKSALDRLETDLAAVRRMALGA